MSEVKPCIHLSNVQLDLAGQPVCENLNLTIGSGTMAALTGRNPACWNLLMRTIAGTQAIMTGTIELWNVPITQIGRRSLNNLVCFIPRQQHPLFDYPVLEYVLAGCETRLKPMQVPEESDRVMAMQILHEMKIERLAHRECDLLSNPERQKVILARALMQNARLLLLDEPVFFLSENEQIEIMSMLLDLTRQHGKTVVFAQEDPWLALQLADQLVIFDNHGIDEILFRTNPDFIASANAVFQRLLLVDPLGHLLDPLKQGQMLDVPNGFLPHTDSKEKSPKSEKLF